MDLGTAMRLATSGMKAQSARMRVTAENLANVESTAQVPGGDPYRRKTITFAGKRDRELGAVFVAVKSYGLDRGDFELRYEPGHPAADAAGYVKYPNVNAFIELMDMREAQRSYEANLSALGVARSLQQKTIDLLR
ncbi:MAG TPA: flagellar basal body rod protein FlgC [Geminicoccaceae bacterium]